MGYSDGVATEILKSKGCEADILKILEKNNLLRGKGSEILNKKCCSLYYSLA